MEVGMELEYITTISRLTEQWPGWSPGRFTCVDGEVTMRQGGGMELVYYWADFDHTKANYYGTRLFVTSHI